ncbi:MAG: hypothetical protein QOG04_1940 [Actinomycetota bacterium]|jgi:uncharacterized Fe-S cluster protein YjdI|nr:hypothetical protein [Actinomycetota bacterium]
MQVFPPWIRLKDVKQDEHPEEAGVPRRKGPTRTYEREELTVIWDASRCTHVAECLVALPEVFDVTRRPWIEVDAADADQVAAAIRKCPTGALKFEARRGFPDEEPDEVTTVRAGHLGPLYIRGKVRLEDGHGRLIAEETRVALCRCGASENKPYCDNSHRLLVKDR